MARRILLKMLSTRLYNKNDDERSKPFSGLRVVCVGLVVVLAVALLLWPSSTRRLASHNKPTITVFSAFQNSPVAQKQQQDLEQNLISDSIAVNLVVLDHNGQRSFIHANSRSCGTKALSRFDEFVRLEQDHLATELWKFCALQSTKGAAYLDLGSPLLVRLQELLRTKTAIAVLGDYFPRTIHGSFLVLREDQILVATQTLDLLLETPVHVFVANSLLVPRTLYALIAANVKDNSLSPGLNKDSWYFLAQECHMNPHLREEDSSWLDTNSLRLWHHCPLKGGFCCSVYDSSDGHVTLMTQNPIMPITKMEQKHVKIPYNMQGHYNKADLPFIATIRQEANASPNRTIYSRPFLGNRFVDYLQNNCLPSDICNDCLSEEESDCNKCVQECSCYCKELCRDDINIFTSKQFLVSPPLYSRDSDRLIPRMVHQVWLDDVTDDVYPDMSRLVQSFKMSGWEHRLYTDNDIEDFLTTHFPSEVREAYDSLVQQSLRWSLFKYCVLLIHGGIVADVSIMLESNLDEVIEPNVGFVATMDEDDVSHISLNA